MREDELYRKQELLNLPKNYTYTGEEISSCAKKVADSGALGPSDFIKIVFNPSAALKLAGVENADVQQKERHELFIRQKDAVMLSGLDIVIFAGMRDNLMAGKLFGSRTVIEPKESYSIVGVGNVYTDGLFFKDLPSREEVDNRVKVAATTLEAELIKFYHEQHPATKVAHAESKRTQPILNPAVLRAVAEYKKYGRKRA